MNDEYLIFNGINASNGEYLLPPLTPRQLSHIIVGEEPKDSEQLRDLKWWRQRFTERQLALKPGVAPLNLAETGWGVIFAHDADPAIKEALGELLRHRQQQASGLKSNRYQVYEGERGYQPGESKQKFLARLKAGTAGAVDPDKIPYYLLIVGSPAAIPYDFQYNLDIQYAVGRLHFDTDTNEEYAHYARSVVAAEAGAVNLPRRAVFFGVQNPGDGATQLSATELVKPLADSVAQEQPDWQVLAPTVEATSKNELRRYLGGKDTPALLFTASHGMAFPNGHPLQVSHQGALLCQDWPGPANWRQAIPPDFYFAGEDIDEHAQLLGLITFHFACFGAGTPRLDDFAHRTFQDAQPIAPKPFVARLPQKLLSHPKGGALAVVGHVDRAWGCSFFSQSGRQLTDFEATFKRLLEGHPIGSAMEFFNVRYAELSADLNAEMQNIWGGQKPDEKTLISLWTANNDARSYIMLGDPAVRLPSSNQSIKKHIG